MTSFPPETQGDLIRWARGHSTQAAFAAARGINKSCLSRYESGKLGAPTHLINYCLRQLAQTLSDSSRAHPELGGALQSARKTVSLLEGAAGLKG
ncbi:XRE family transcriptional regulator [Ralstonia nicotianae]